MIKEMTLALLPYLFDLYRFDQGGYCIDTLAESATWTLRSLLGDPCSPLHACINPDPM
jgi:hypothetical protein